MEGLFPHPEGAEMIVEGLFPCHTHIQKMCGAGSVRVSDFGEILTYLVPTLGRGGDGTGCLFPHPAGAWEGL